MLLGLSLFDPLGGIGQDIVGWFGHSISQGIGGFASWAIGGVIHAMQATTTPDFTSWFAGPWRAMLSVVAWLSVPILFGGVFGEGFVVEIQSPIPILAHFPFLALGQEL